MMMSESKTPFEATETYDDTIVPQVVGPAVSESVVPSELTEPGDRTKAMMYWHERAMQAESDLADARAEVERLRKIMSHIDGLTVIKAKEAAGYGVQVRALSAKEPT